MTYRTTIVFVVAVALATVAPARPAAAMSAPALGLALGRTFGADAAPSDGGFSLALSPTWPVGGGARFGVTVFADDIGTNLSQLADPNDGTPLGAVASLHRMAWGAAWRADVDVARHGAWTAAASGTLGWWRTVDDSRGNFSAAASAVGIGLGAVIRHPVASGQRAGLVVRGQRLFAERNSAYRRMETYASAALEWNWTGAPRP